MEEPVEAVYVMTSVIADGVTVVVAVEVTGKYSVTTVKIPEVTEEITTLPV